MYVCVCVCVCVWVCVCACCMCMYVCVYVHACSYITMVMGACPCTTMRFVTQHASSCGAGTCSSFAASSNAAFVFTDDLRSPMCVHS